MPRIYSFNLLLVCSEMQEDFFVSKEDMQLHWDNKYLYKIMQLNYYMLTN